MEHQMAIISLSCVKANGVADGRQYWFTRQWKPVLGTVLVMNKIRQILTKVAYAAVMASQRTLMRFQLVGGQCFRVFE